jgi:hypothetical protein
MIWLVAIAGALFLIAGCAQLNCYIESLRNAALARREEDEEEALR